MLGIRVILLVAAVLLTACSRRWEEKTYERGVFSVVEHWVETEYWMLDRRSGVEYTEICNSKTSGCFHNSGGSAYRDRKPRTAWILVSKINGYAALYYDNVAGKLLNNPVFSVYALESGDSLNCKMEHRDGDDIMKGVTEADYSWRGRGGIGDFHSPGIQGSASKIFLVDARSDKDCKISILKEYGDSVELGNIDLDPKSQNAAWSHCRTDCEVSVLNIPSSEERSFPFQRCKSAPDMGFVKWIDGELHHTCPGGEEPKVLKWHNDGTGFDTERRRL